MQKQADKLQGQAKAALAQGNEDLAREALSRRAALGEQLTELKTQHDQITEQESEARRDLPGAPVPSRAVPHAEGDAEGLVHGGRGPDQGRRGGVGDLQLDASAGATMQRAQDKIASMQARAGAIDELLASGALEDLTTPVDDIQKELDKVSSTNQVDNELAALKAEMGTGADGAAGSGAADGSGGTAALPSASAPASAEPAEQGGTGGENT